MYNMIVYLTNIKTNELKIYLSAYDTEDEAIDEALSELNLSVPTTKQYDDTIFAGEQLVHEGYKIEVMFFDEPGWVLNNEN